MPGWRPALLERTDPILLWGPVALCAIAPLASGSVEAWSDSLLIAAAGALAAVWLLRHLVCHAACIREREAQSHLAGWSAGLHPPLIALLAVGLVQLAPLGALVAALSPAAAELQQIAGTTPEAFTLSLFREGTLLSLAHLAALGLLFFTILDSCHGRRDVRRLAAALVAVGLAHAVAGVLWHYARGGESYWSPGRSSFGPYVNRNHFAGLMGMVIPLGVGSLLSLGYRPTPPVSAGMRPAGGGRPGAELRPRQVLLGFAVAVMGGALSLTLSRGGIAATLGALALLAVIVAVDPRTRRRSPAILATTVVVLGFGIWLAAEPLLQRVATVGAVFAEPLADVRAAIWKDTLRMIGNFPLFGAGLGAYGVVIPHFQTAYAGKEIVHAHNDWLELLAEGGLAGALAGLALLGAYITRAARLLLRRRDREALVIGLGGLCGLLAFLAHGVTEFNAHIPANALWFTVLAALTLKAISSKV